jgi:hypothetical protein
MACVRRAVKNDGSPVATIVEGVKRAMAGESSARCRRRKVIHCHH